ncbi:MAG: DUF4238 domain-containing protein [Ignavibacteriae bacterium]|nr:MAG: DUF4238 domain-containing protein [Ignavibacteriota bacterium]
MAERHHYISRFYLNYFSPAKHPGKVWVYTGKRPALQSIKRYVANIENFYTISTEKGDSNIIEKELSKLETHTGRIIKKLHGNDFNLTKDELETMVTFISYLRARTPALRDSVNSSITMERTAMLRMIASDEALFKKEMGENNEITFKEFKDHVFQNLESMDMNMNSHEATNVMTFAAEEIKKMLSEMKWNFFVAPNNFNYVTSDNPVFPFMNNWKMPYQPGFAFKDVEVYFPVTPKISMLGTYMDVSVSKVVTGDTVNVINSRIINNRYEYMYSNMNEEEFSAQCDLTINKLF